MPDDIDIDLKTAIRDYWERDSSAVQIARAALHDAVGYPVRIDLDWLRLLGQLEAVYADRGALVAAVAGCVEIWCKVFVELVKGAETDAADDAQREWAEALTARLQSCRKLRLYVYVADPWVSIKPGTKLSGPPAAFYLYLPARQPATVPSENAALYRSGLLRCFKGKEPEQETEKKNDEPLPLPRPAKPEYLPSVESLARPDVLLLRPPYHLIVSDYGAKKVVVQGSHGPSLRLLGEYMARWCQTNHQDARKPAAVAVKYNQSCWAAGPMPDQVTLTSEGNNIYCFNPTIVLAVVEGVLGYDLVSTEPGVWTYRRTEAFRG